MLLKPFGTKIHVCNLMKDPEPEAEHNQPTAPIASVTFGGLCGWGRGLASGRHASSESGGARWRRPRGGGCAMARASSLWRLGGPITAFCTAEGQLFTFWDGDYMYRRLGHNNHKGQQDELVPRLIVALAGKKVVCAAAGGQHRAVRTEAGALHL